MNYSLGNKFRIIVCRLCNNIKTIWENEQENPNDKHELCMRCYTGIEKKWTRDEGLDEFVEKIVDAELVMKTLTQER